MISLNSTRSLSEYLIVGPLFSYIGVSNTDFVNSGSYFTALLVVVFGITTLVGLGGSFLMTGLAVGLIDTNDLGSIAPFFLGKGLAATATGGGATGFTSGFGAAFATGGGAAFFAGSAFLGAGFATDFLGTGFSFFLGAAFLAAGFARGFLAAFLGAGLAGFFGAGFFLLAIQLAFF
ncbi:MAG: hypothetical protein WDO16_25660 [Bacteroidota bacterium]